MAKAKTIQQLEGDLSRKEIDYVLEYIKNGNNACKAAKVAGYAKTTSSRKAYKWIGKNLSDSEKPEMYLYYQALLKEAKKEFSIDFGQVVSELKSIAFADITELVELSGFKMVVKSVDDIPQWMRPAIQSITRSSYGVTIKLFNKLDALKTLIEVNKDAGQFDGDGVNIENVTFNVKGSSSKLLEEPKKDD